MATSHKPLLTSMLHGLVRSSTKLVLLVRESGLSAPSRFYFQPFAHLRILNSVWYSVRPPHLFTFQCFVFLLLCLLGSSSSTHVSGQCVAWLNAGWALSCWAMTWRRKRPTCWWRPFSYTLHLSRPLGSHTLFFWSPPSPLSYISLLVQWVTWLNSSSFLSSPQVGFLRFLHLLSSFDWRNNPLIINLNNQLTGKHSHKHIHAAFFPPSSSLPSLCIHTKYNLTNRLSHPAHAHESAKASLNCCCPVCHV